MLELGFVAFKKYHCGLKPIEVRDNERDVGWGGFAKTGALNPLADSTFKFGYGFARLSLVAVGVDLDLKKKVVGQEPKRLLAAFSGSGDKASGAWEALFLNVAGKPHRLLSSFGCQAV